MTGIILFGACEQPCLFQGVGWEVVEGKEQLPGSAGQFTEHLVASSCLSYVNKQNQKYSLCWGILEVKFRSEQWLWKWIDESWPFNHGNCSSAPDLIY